MRCRISLVRRLGLVVDQAYRGVLPGAPGYASCRGRAGQGSLERPVDWSWQCAATAPTGLSAAARGGPAARAALGLPRYAYLVVLREARHPLGLGGHGRDLRGQGLRVLGDGEQGGGAGYRYVVLV